jgi:hypothetical protein
MFVYVGTGPDDIEACKFLSRTRVDRFCAACAIFGCDNAMFEGIGVTAPVPKADPGGRGVEVPLLFCVAKTEASFRDASPTICLIFLFRR